MITFDGIDLIFECAISDSELRGAISDVFFTEPDRIALISDLADYPSNSLEMIVCVISKVTGQFTSLVSIRCSTELNYDEKLEPVQRLANKLNVSCITPTEDINPYLMYHVKPNGKVEQVSLDVDADEDQYILSRKK